LVLFSLIGPLVHYDNLRFSPPFESFFEPSMNRLPSSSVNNPRLKQLSSSRFNVTNPSYATLHRNSPSQFGILIKTR
uniref:Ovule protein n=1 Tax=Anisakis simplex TaxID=6269 RepID=A0A0M3J3T0_ANISI